MDVFLIGIYDDGMLFWFVDPADVKLIGDYDDAMEARAKVARFKVEGRECVDLDELLQLSARGKINVVGTIEGTHY